MVREHFFPHLSSLRYHSHRKHDQDHSLRRTGGWKQGEKQKEKEKKAVRQEARGREEEELLIRRKKTERRKVTIFQPMLSE